MTRAPEGILLELLNAPSEGEVLEFKDRKNISDDDTGEYLSPCPTRSSPESIPSPR